MLFNKRKKSIITLGIGQVPREEAAPPARPAATARSEPVQVPAKPEPPPRLDVPTEPPAASVEQPAPVSHPEAPPAAAPGAQAPPAAVPAEAKAPEPVETAATLQPEAEVPAARVEVSPEQVPETPSAEFEIQAEEVPGETAGFIQCPFCLKSSRVGLTHCESCGNLIESARVPAEPEPHAAEPEPHAAEPEPEAAVPEPAVPAAPGAVLVERPDQADTHRLAHHPVPQILKETTLFTPAMLRLQPEQGHTGEKTYNLNIGDSTIGRGIDNTLAFPDEEFISRRHCSISYHKYQYVLKDRDSANGTYVNDVRIRETILRDGDCVQIGSMRFIFDDPMERVKKKKAAAGED